MTGSPPLRWSHWIGDPETWSKTGALVALTISTIVFVFGNMAAIASAPLELLGFNTAATIAVIATLALTARFLPGQFTPALRAFVVGGILVALSAARGLGFDALLVALTLTPEPTPMLRALISVTVFAPGVWLALISSRALRQWRETQAQLETLRDQLHTTKSLVYSEINRRAQETKDAIVSLISPRLASIASQNREDAKATLRAVVSEIVRPVSYELATRTTPIEPAPPRPIAIRLQRFLEVALAGKPFASVLSGVLFAFTLVPRVVASDGPLQGLVATIVMGFTLGLGAGGLNALSRRLVSRLPVVLHAVVLLTGSLFIGLLLGALSFLLLEGDLGLGDVFIVGAVATSTILVLLALAKGSITFFEHQRLELELLSDQLQRAIARANALQWQRSRSLSHWLHGSFQATLTRALLQLSGEAPLSAKEISHDVVTELQDIQTADTTPVNLRVSIERLSVMWGELLELRTDINPALLEHVSGSPAESAINEVLSEGVFNAIKHASPPWLEVMLASEGTDTAVLSIRHPGHLAPTSTGGLGSEVYRQLTLSFELDEENGIVSLVARIPLQAPTDHESDR